MSHSQGDVLTGGSPAAVKELLLANCRIDLDEIRFSSNTYRFSNNARPVAIRRVFFESRPYEYSDGSKPSWYWDGRADIYRAVPSIGE